MELVPKLEMLHVLVNHYILSYYYSKPKRTVVVKLSNKFPHIINGIRGIGLIQGLVINDLYTDAKTITLKAFDKGLLLVPAGGNVVRFVPPLIISRNEINILLKKLDLIFEEL